HRTTTADQRGGIRRPIVAIEPPRLHHHRIRVQNVERNWLGSAGRGGVGRELEPGLGLGQAEVAIGLFAGPALPGPEEYINRFSIWTLHLDSAENRGPRHELE